MKLDRFILIAFNGLARLFGVLAILAGIVSLVSAYVVAYAVECMDLLHGYRILVDQIDQCGTAHSNETPDGASRVARQLTLAKGGSGSTPEIV